MSTLGPLSGETPAAPALGDYGDLAARIQKQSDARQAYFNQLTEQLKARRYGPSASKDKRAAEAARASDMEKLGLARLNMGDDEVKTALELQRLRAQYAKDAAPKLDALPGGGYQQQPGTGGAPPYPNSDDNGVYIIEDPRQLKYLPPNSPIRRPNDPMVKYTPGV